MLAQLMLAVKASPAPRPVPSPQPSRGLLDGLLSHLPQPWPPLWAFLIPLVVGVVVMPWAIGVLARAGMGQKIREEGPRSHMAKGGTPTAGGIVVIGLILLTLLILDRSRDVIPALVALLLAGGSGSSTTWSR